MVISKENKDFIDSLIDYYISESESYKQIAENFIPEIESIPDTAFGIITGCVYSGFLQAYQNQQETPSLEDMREFNQIIKDRAAQIKKSIIDPPKVESTSNEAKITPEDTDSED
ncbi:hypothetical protein C5F49_06520 [Nitrosopumilus oxyclinae]|uniref:Uncharacterized protein n=1 Tax=Nitrosopumilus oxyclinae TaxID=1959104 RepID=A0A7D5M1V4_9ARCH|nr:hypothetical protein [Nitrosopumilus oxyclinae]QLH05006.1 hypothetical protein C5F49_06520 [Nitrosopumilus oxyclinae]